METTYPDWATEKQIEGMKLFSSILTEYLWLMDVEFKQADSDEDHSRFYAVVSWDAEEKGKRQHQFDIAFDYEAIWNSIGDRIHEWQFLFGGGDATRELSNEVLFMDLFWYMDKTAVTAA